jgi:hypothetical protein
MAGPTAIGLQFGTGSGGSIAKGLAFTNFFTGVELDDNSITLMGDAFGTNAAGTKLLGNGTGVINRGSNNSILNSLFVDSALDGVFNDHSGGDMILGNLFGQDPTNGLARPNGRYNVGEDGGTANLYQGNISGDAGQDDYWTHNSSGDSFFGNDIGQTPTGAPAGNTLNGLVFHNSDHMTSGGPAPGRGNIVVNNGANGLFITGTLSNGIVAQGNNIGTDAAGTPRKGNTQDGVNINGGASNNTVSGNVVSDNQGGGIHLDGTVAFLAGTVIANNKIGTDISGSIALGNAGGGIIVNQAALSTLQNNIISGNRANGVLITGNMATGNLVQGNFIGTNAAGTGALPNASNGVMIQNGASGNMIGGTSSGSGNVISGNAGGGGILITDPGTNNNTVQRNFIGTDDTGNMALSNAFGGGIESGASNNTIVNNTFSGNLADGVDINGAGTNGNLVQGGFIGTNSAGTAALGNGGIGFFVNGGQNNDVNRVAISGNTGDGVRLDGGATGNLFKFNFVGTDFTGTKAIGNGGSGYHFLVAPHNAIGAAGAAGSGGVISANALDGITIDLGSDNTTIVNAEIGTDITGTQNLGNRGNGISTAANHITATASDIWDNGGDGIHYVYAPGSDNEFLGDSFFLNNGLGINNGFPNTTTHCGGTAVPTNPPALISAFRGVGGSLAITGDLDEEPNATFHVDLFANPSTSSSFPQAMLSLGSLNVTTGSNCIGSFTVTFPVPAPGLFGPSVNITGIATGIGMKGSSLISFAIPIVAATVPITVDTLPPGLNVTVDGVTSVSPQTFNWVPGSTHTIATTSPQAGTPGEQFVWTSWSDGGAVSHTVIAPPSASTFTANFKTQFQLTTGASPAGAGMVTPPSGNFYDALSMVNVSESPVSGSGFAFTGWSGPVADPFSPSTHVIMTMPVSAIADYTLIYSPSILNFLNVQNGQNATLSFTVTANLAVTARPGTITAGSSNFTIVQQPPTTPIPKGGTFFLKLNFAPNGVGPFTGNLLVPTNLGDYNFALMGNGTDAPPVIHVPGSVTAAATSPAGSTVTFVVTAFDLEPGTVVLTCSPGSGTFFPVGTTTVNCIATDAAGLTATASFPVTVILGMPQLNITIVGKGLGPNGTHFVDLQTMDIGTGNAFNVQIKKLNFRTLNGTGTVTYNPTVSGVLPLSEGNINVNASNTVRIFLNIPSGVLRYSIIESGCYQDVLGKTFNYSFAQAATP